MKKFNFEMETYMELRNANQLAIMKELYQLGELSKEEYVSNLKKALQFERRQFEFEA